MAVRTSNVYEDSGVVIYEPEVEEDEPTNLPSGRGAGFTAYVGWHLKHQLAQDLFWLIAALTTLCTFEVSCQLCGLITNTDSAYSAPGSWMNQRLISTSSLSSSRLSARSPTLGSRLGLPR